MPAPMGRKSSAGEFQVFAASAARGDVKRHRSTVCLAFRHRCPRAISLLCCASQRPLRREAKFQKGVFLLFAHLQPPPPRARCACPFVARGASRGPRTSSTRWRSQGWHTGLVIMFLFFGVSVTQGLATSHAGPLSWASAGKGRCAGLAASCRACRATSKDRDALNGVVSQANFELKRRHKRRRSEEPNL